MEETKKYIEHVTSQFREVTQNYFKYKPLNAPIIDSYNYLVEVVVHDIVTTPRYFKTDTKIHKLQFSNVIRVPPFKDALYMQSIKEIVDEIRTNMEGKDEKEIDKEIQKRTKAYYSESMVDDSKLKHRMTAKDVRLNGESYVLTIYADLEHTMLDVTDEDIPNDASNFPEIMNAGIQSKAITTKDDMLKIFYFPLMMGSSYDWLILSGVPKSEWSFFGECDLDPMGNFYISGNPKVFVNQLKLLPNNASCIEKTTFGKRIEIRSETPDKMSKSLKMQFVKLPNSAGGGKVCHIILPYITAKTKKQGESSTKVPKPQFNVFWLWRLFILADAIKEGRMTPPCNDQIFGLPDGRSALETLDDFNKHLKQATKENTRVYNAVVTELTDTIRHFRSSDDSSLNDVEFVDKMMKLLKQKTSEDYCFSVLALVRVLDSQFFPHIGGEYQYYSEEEDWVPNRKFLSLTQMIVRYIKFYEGAKPVDDLNHMEIQQIATVGIELGFLLRKGFDIIMNKIENELSGNNKKKKKTNNHFIPANEVPRYGKDMSQQLITAFATGRWGFSETGKKREGVVQQHDINSILSKWNMIRKCMIPIQKQSKLVKPRMVHQSSYGLIDPTSTPDSAQVGLVKQLAVSVYISVENQDTTKLLKDTIEADIIKFEIASRIRIEGSFEIPIIFNFTFMGFCNDIFIKKIKDIKRKQFPHIEAYIKTEVDAWETSDEFHIRTGEGRAIRPLLIVNEDQTIPLLTLLEKEPESAKDFAYLLHQGCVEYVSAGEFEFTETALTFDDFQKGRAKGRQYTHIELDPYMSMSIEVAVQPFPGFNPNPRVMYFSSMVRQAISIPHSTFQQRFDTDVKILNYAHRPLITTEMAKIVGLTEQPFGNNVIVAIKSTEGTDEDATVWKKSFFERGGLTATLYETYKIKKAATVDDQEDDQTIFNKGVIRTRRNISPEDEEFSKTQGKVNFVKLSGASSVEVSPGDLLARYKMNQDPNTEIKNERLEGHRSGYINGHHSTNQTEMISVRYPHIPGPGDKFANMYAQKGVIGNVVADENMPFSERTGIMPDVIFSPTSFASRMTTGMFAEIFIGGAIIACDRSRFVKNLIRWRKSDVKPEIREDFWIVVQPYVVNPNDNSDFKRRNVLEKELRRKYRDQIGPEEIEAFIQSDIREKWLENYGIKFNSGVYEETLIVPEEKYLSKMSTGERVIKYSQLPVNLQIKYHIDFGDSIVPKYLLVKPRIKADESLRDATAFRDAKYEDAEKLLVAKGYSYSGEHIMVDGRTGQRSKMKIFMGPCHRMGLKHLTENKYQTRDKGNISAITRGTTKGKSAGGAVRHGELTHSALYAHGALDFLEERFMNAADKYEILTCQKCGDQCYVSTGITKSIKPVCETCGHDGLPLKISVPYSGLRFLAFLSATGQKVQYKVGLHPEFEVDDVDKFPDDPFQAPERVN
tara:strand:- start:320 stop:4642 length:4323 start_codon:yes stop_codon:yes gene_type:complete